MPSRSYDNNHHRNSNHHRGGFSAPGNNQRHLPFDSPPPNYPAAGATGFRPMTAGAGGGPGGFRPMGAGAGGFRPMGVGSEGGFRPMGGGGGGGGPGFNRGGADVDTGYPMPHAGQKRAYSLSGRGTSPGTDIYISSDGPDSGSFAKLFVGSVPRTATEDDIRPLFEEHGEVIEVALLKDKRTGQQQGCCFIKYATSEEADRAIGGLHNKYTLPGGVGPIQVRYADGERERLGAVEHKLFVGSLNKQATEKEIEEIFAPYGRVEDVYIMRDEMKQSRGCGFVKFSHRDMAAAAIAALSGIYVMRGCEQPLTVRFADPKRPRGAESRGGPAFGGPGFGGSRSQPSSGVRPPSYLGDSMGGHPPASAYNPMSSQSVGPSQVNAHGLGSHLNGRGGAAPVPSSMGGGPLGAHGGPMNGTVSGVPLQQTPDISLSQASGQQISPMQRPLQSPQHLLPPFQLHSQQMPGSYPQKDTQATIQQPGQLQNPSSTGQSSSAQMMPSQQLFGSSGQVPVSQSQVQHSVSSAATQFFPPNFQRPGFSAPASQQQLPQPLQQSPTQLAQVLSQQTQALQASYQSSQQAFSQLQQQLHMIQQSNQNPNPSQNQTSQVNKQQSPWAGTMPHTGSSTNAATMPMVPPSTSSSSSAAASASMQMTAPLTCNWTEHTSPEGFKYYYNSVTTESKWEKPEELILFEQQQQHKQQQQQQQLQLQHQHLQPPQQQQLQQHQQQQHNSSVQPQPQSQTHSQPQLLSSQQVSQSQQIQLQTQIHNPQQFQPQRALSSSSDLGYAQTQPVPSMGFDVARFQQGQQAAQEWMWKNKPAGA